MIETFDVRLRFVAVEQCLASPIVTIFYQNGGATTDLGYVISIFHGLNLTILNLLSETQVVLASADVLALFRLANLHRIFPAIRCILEYSVEVYLCKDEQLRVSDVADKRGLVGTHGNSIVLPMNLALAN